MELLWPFNYWIELLDAPSDSAVSAIRTQSANQPIAFVKGWVSLQVWLCWIGLVPSFGAWVNWLDQGSQLTGCIAKTKSFIFVVSDTYVFSI